MTEKRFTIIETQIGRVIRDNETDVNTGDIGIIFDWLNGLAEKNKLHKERISLLSSLLDLADAIIDTSDNEKAKQVWDNKNKQTEKEWERILNE